MQQTGRPAQGFVAAHPKERRQDEHQCAQVVPQPVPDQRVDRRRSRWATQRGIKRHVAQRAPQGGHQRKRQQPVILAHQIGNMKACRDGKQRDRGHQEERTQVCPGGTGTPVLDPWHAQHQQGRGVTRQQPGPSPRGQEQQAGNTQPRRQVPLIHGASPSQQERDAVAHAQQSSLGNVFSSSHSTIRGVSEPLYKPRALQE